MKWSPKVIFLFVAGAVAAAVIGYYVNNWLTGQSPANKLVSGKRLIPSQPIYPTRQHTFGLRKGHKSKKG